MTLTKWLLLILFALGFFYFVEDLVKHFIKPNAPYLCLLFSVCMILLGAYFLWTGRIPSEWGKRGVEYTGAWAYIISLGVIGLAIWLLVEHCLSPTIVIP